MTTRTHFRARTLRLLASAASVFALAAVGCGSAASDESAASTSSSQDLQIERARTIDIDHVLLISIDGMHQVDLERFLETHPHSALAHLAERGLQYKHAHVNTLDGSPTNPSDSFPGLLALTTGGSSPSTGAWYDVSFARDLYTDSTCETRGTAVAYDETAELDNSSLWGSTAAGVGPTHEVAVVRSRLDATKLPYRKTAKGCEPVYPHDYPRVNSMFEVAHAAGLHTAWSDKHPAYEIVSGLSGAGVDDFFAPEINSDATNLPGTGAAAGEDFTTKTAYTKVYDDFKVRAILNQIDGRYSDDGLAGATDVHSRPGVPSIFGMNFQAVSVAEKDAKIGPGGYVDAAGTPSAELEDAIEHTDASIGSFVQALRERGLEDSTLIIVTAKHGQSPIDHSIVAKRDGDAVAALVDGASKVAGHIEDDVALYWLKDGTGAGAAATVLRNAPVTGAANDPSVDRVFTRNDPGFIAMFGDPAVDPRTPDVVVQPKAGTIYSLSKKKWAEHGGFATDDSHVALLVSNPALCARVVHEGVRTKQVAPTVLAALGLNPEKLDAVRMESTEVLPGLRFRRHHH
jgi:hypothetical protein